MRKKLVGATLLVVSLHAAATPLQCKGDDQLYGTLCITKPMADLIACIESTGGNRSELISIVGANEGKSAEGSASASVATKGKLVDGSASLKLSRQEELAALNRIELRYFSGGASICADFARTIKATSAKPVAPRLPVQRTVSGSRVVFFGDFAVNVRRWYKGGENPLTIELFTPENGLIYVEAGQPPLDVTFKSVNYLLSAKESGEGRPPILILSR